MILAWGAGRLALVPDEVLATVTRYATGPEAEREAGGILIGAYRGEHLEVTGCTEPMPMDTRRRSLFDRKDPGHQRAAMAAWSSSLRTETYVGEWHTHPEARPSPSSTDLATWASIMNKTRFPILFLIGGSQMIWKGVGQRGEVVLARGISGE